METKEKLLSLMQEWESIATVVGIPFYEAMFDLQNFSSTTALTETLTAEIKQVIEAFEQGILSQEDFRRDWNIYERGIQAVVYEEHLDLKLREPLRACFAWAFPEPLTEGTTL